MLSLDVPKKVHEVLSHISSLSTFNVAVVCTAVFAFIKLIHILRRRVRTSKLRGPPTRPSFVYSIGRLLVGAEDPASIYDSRARAYGAAFEISSALGGRRIVLYDLKAIAHFLARQSWMYARTPTAKKALERGGILWADRESHKRQRKLLIPAFNVAAIRKLTPIFYDSAHKAKEAWHALIESSDGDGVIIEVQRWMNHISIDTIGLAGFSHDFGALRGNPNSIVRIIDAFNASPVQSAFDICIALLAPVFPFLLQVPTKRRRIMWKFNHAMEEVSNVLIARTKQELDIGVVGEKEEKSIIGLLIKRESAESESHLSKEEVLAQMKTLIFAAYRTTSVGLTWAFIELSRNPDIQTKLRNELLEHGSDPTYDQLASGLPYLDAVVHETLRMHAPVREMTRMATEDDIIPLSKPVCTKTGELTDHLSIAKGTSITIPLTSVNRSVDVWGEDAGLFKPRRWLEDKHGYNEIPAKTKEVPGYRHLLTFSDGPRSCLGRNLAVTKMKAVLSVLVKNFVFELRDGAETKIELGQGIIPRPRVAGEVGYKVPLRMRPYVG